MLPVILQRSCNVVRGEGSTLFFAAEEAPVRSTLFLDSERQAGKL